MSKPSKCLQLLLNRSQRIQPWRPMRRVEPTSHQRVLLGRMETRRWVGLAKETVLMQIRELAFEIKWIKHVETCRTCLLEIQLNIERYGGGRLPWYLDLINDVNQMTEDFVFKGCPKVEDYRIGSYWRGSSEDTFRFIKDRLNWAEEITRKQLVAAVAYLKLLMNWNFDWEPPLFWGVKNE